MSTLDGENNTVDNGLVALLVIAERGNLRQQIIEPCTGAGMAVRARQSNVLLAIEGVLAAERSDAVQNAIAHGGVARLGVNDNVDETVVGVALVADDEGAAEETLAQAGAFLVEVGIAGKVDLDDRTGNVGLAHANQVLVAARRRRR